MASDSQQGLKTRVRQDVHRPSVMEPADYVWVGFEDAHHEDGFTEWDLDAYYAATGLPVNPMSSRSWSGDHLAEAEDQDSWWWNRSGGCAHCGQSRIRYWSFFVHKPTGKLVAVGGTCAGKLNLASRAQLDYKAHREARRILKIRERWMATDQDREIAFAFADYEVARGHHGHEGMRHRFVANVRRYGSVSDRFVRAMMRDMARTERREEEEAARAAELRPVVEGKIEIRGTILSLKFQDNDFGGSMKMLVLDDRGFKVWGTRPQAIWQAEKGDRIVFTATVARSEKDETFGFFARPTKADYIDQGEAQS